MGNSLKGNGRFHSRQKGEGALDLGKRNQLSKVSGRFLVSCVSLSAAASRYLFVTTSSISARPLSG